MQKTFLILTFVVTCWFSLSRADGKQHLINVQHYIDLLTPISQRQDERITRNCKNMALFGVTDDGIAGLISKIETDRCRQHYELSTETMHISLEEYLTGMRAYACEKANGRRPGGLGKDERQRNAIYCETGVWEYSTDSRNGTTEESVISVTEFLIMPALVCAAAAREFAPEQRNGYCAFIAPPADPDLLQPWGQLIGQAGMLPLNNFSSFRDDACMSYPSGDPTSPAAEHFNDVLGNARDSAGMVSRFEALGLECGPSDLRGLDADEPDVLCRQSNYLGSRWSRSDTDPTTLQVLSFGDYLAIGIFDDAENGETRICLAVGSIGI